MRRLRRIALTIAAFLLIMSSVFVSLAATEAGTRWLLQRAGAFLPPALALDGPSGTLLRGVEFEAVGWSDEAATISARRVYAHVELLPLLRGDVSIEALRVGSADVRILDQEPSDEPSQPLNVDLPIDLYIAELDLSDIDIEAAGTARSIERLTLTASLVDSDLRIDSLSVRADWLTLDMDGNVTLRPKLPLTLAADWQFNSDAGRFGGSLDASGNLDAYDIEHRLTTPVAVDTRGSVSLAGDLPVLDLVSRWQDLTWPLPDGDASSADGSLELDGAIDDLEIRLSASVSVNELPQSQVELDGRSSLERLEIGRLSLKNLYGELLADGMLQWSPGVSFDAGFELSGLDPARLRPDLAGDIAMKGEIAGTLEEDGLELRSRISQLSGNLNDHPVTGDGLFSLQSGTLEIEGLKLGVGVNRLTAKGIVGQQLAVTSRIEANDLSQIVPSAAGRIGAAVNLRGRTDRPAGEAEISGSELSFAGFALGDIAIRARLESDQSIDADLTVNGLQAGEQRIDSVALTFVGSQEQHRMTAGVSAYDSRIELAASGGYRQPAWSGILESLAIDNPVMGRWSSREPTELTAAPDFASLAPLCLLGLQGSVCIDGKYSKAEGTSATLAIEALPVAALPLPLPAGVRAEGSIFAGASLTLLPDGLSGTAEFDVRDALVRSLLDDEEYVAELPKLRVDASVVDNVLAAELDIRTADDGGEISATVGLSDVMVPRDADLSGQGSIRIADASLLAALFPDISNPTGRIEGNVTLAGTPKLPEVTGELRLVDGALGIRRAGIEVTDINIRLAQESPASLTLRGSAASGDGTLSITGDTTFDTESGIRTVLSIDGEQFRILRTADFHASASPDVDIVIDERRVEITGDLLIPEADIRIRDIPASATKPSSDAVVYRDDVGATQQEARQFDLELNAALGDNVRLAAFGLKTRLAGLVRLRGSTGRPIAGFGRVSLEEGTYKSYGQELDIETGLLIFNGPLDNPRLDVRATRQVNDVLAGIHLTGTPTNLRSEVYSQPPLRDVEVLSYLLTGRPLSSGASPSESDLLSKAAFSLGMSGAGSIASRLRNELGLDSLSVEGGAEDGRIVAGKRLSENLTVEYGYGLIDRLGSLLLRYQINERLILETRTGTVSNIDLVYRVRRP